MADDRRPADDVAGVGIRRRSRVAVDLVTGVLGLCLDLVVLAAAGSAIFALRAPFSAPVVRFADVAPVWLGGLAALLLLAVCARRSPLVVGLAAAGCLQPAWLMADDMTQAAAHALAPAPTGPRLKLLDVNVWSTNTQYDRFRALVAREAPDVIIVQEAFRGWKAVLVGLGPDYAIASGCRYASDCNVVILTRLEVVAPLAPWTSDMAAVRLGLPKTLGGGTIDVVGVHLERGATSAMRAADLAEIAALIGPLPRRALIAGDFNTTPWSGVLARLDQVGGLDRHSRALMTWPTPTRRFTSHALTLPAPLAAIDHVYAGQSLRLAEIRRGPDIGSDHYPIIATFVVQNDETAKSKSQVADDSAEP